MNVLHKLQELQKAIRKRDILPFVNRKEDYLHLPYVKIEQVVAGDSRARYSIYPPVFSEYTWNAGESAADLFTSYHMAQFLLNNCPHVKRVVLMYAFYNRGYDLSKSNNKRLSTVFHHFFPWIPLRKIPRLLHYAITIKLWLNKKMRPTRPANPYGYDHPNAYTADTSYLINANIKQAIKYGKEPLQFIKKLSVLCKSKQVELYICIPPERSDYRNILKNKIDINKILQEDSDTLNLPVIDTRDWIHDDFFGDAYHLNEIGAKDFSGKLNAFFQDRGNL